MAEKGVLILRARARALGNSLRGGALPRRLPFVLLGLSLWVLLYVGTYKSISYVRGIEIVGEALAVRLLRMMFFGLTGFVFLSNLITAVSSFYLSKDLGFLLAKPLRAMDILFYKTVDTVFNSSWMALSFMPPVFAAFGAAYGAPPAYYAGVFFFFALFMLVLAGPAILAAHLLVRLFPAKRLRDAFVFSGLMLFLLVYFLLRSSMPSDADPLRVIEVFAAFGPEMPFMPDYWMSETAYSMLRGRPPEVLYAALLLSNGLFFLMASLLAGGRLWRGSLDRLGSGRQKGGRGRGYPGWALLYKDARLFVRDAAQWSQLVIILALAFVYVYNFTSLPLEAASGIAPFIKEALVFINMLMAALVLSAVAARFIYPAVSLEGQAFWVIKTSPLSMKRFLAGKFLHGTLPVAALLLIIVFATNLLLDAGSFLMLLSLGTVFLLSVSVGGLGAGLGALRPQFKYENIASVSMGMGAVLFMLIAFSVSLLTVGLEAWPYYLYAAKGRPSWPETALAFSLIACINFLAFYLPMRAGLRNLRRLEL